MTPADPVEETPPGAGHLGLWRELGDLKRVYSAQNTGSVATRLFGAAWDDLIRGVPTETVMLTTVAAALVAVRLGDIDRRQLSDLGVSAEEASEIAGRAFDVVAGTLDPALRHAARAQLATPLGPAPTVAVAGVRPDCLTLLARQPRAGVTSPDLARLLLQPQESHADHCAVVAIYGAISAAAFGADAADVFLAGLGHHLHNAYVPDGGFSGELLLGTHLDGIVARARQRALAQFSPSLAASVSAATADIGAAITPKARAFHAADVIDRVLEIEQHFKLTGLSMRHVLDDYGLVHAGPVKDFHDRVLRSVGLT